MVIDCKIVDNPPKLIINVQETTLQIPEIDEEISTHPFVISISPSKIPAIGEGKIEKNGESAVIITKNTAIIAPTEIILKEESKIIDEKFVFDETSFLVDGIFFSREGTLIFL